MSLATPLCLYESVVQQDYPLAWWGLDEASPTADDSGNSKTLTAVGTPANNAPLLTYDAGGTADGARDFNGTTQSYTCGSTLSIRQELMWTIEFWAQFDTVAGTQTIVSCGAGVGTAKPQIRRNGTEIEVLVEQGSARWTITSGAGLATSTVYHIVVSGSYDNFAFSTAGSSSAPRRIYVNGVSQTLSNGVGAFGTAATTWSVRIGSKTGGSEWFDGKLDEVACYDYALSLTQVLQHYNAGKNGTWGTQFLGDSGVGRYPRYALEVAFAQTYQYQGASQQFVDASDLVRHVDFFRGGDNAILNSPRAGTMSFDLDNSGGLFEDAYLGSTLDRFYNSDRSRSNAEPSRACRLRLWWPDTATPVYSMFYGYVESVVFRRRPGDTEPFVSFRAADVLKLLSLAVGDDSGMSDELSSARIVNLLATTTYDLGLPQAFETGNKTVDYHVATGGLLSLIDQVTFTEGGASMFFQGKEGKLKFFNSTHRSGASNSATYGPSNLPFRSADPVHDDSDVYTTAVWDNPNVPITTSQTDNNYKLKHSDRVHTRTTLHNSSGDLDAAALAFVNRFKESQKRIPTINPLPQAHSAPATAWATWMGHELSDKITVVDTMDGGLGTTSLVRYIEGIGMRMGAGAVECTLNISPYS